MKAMIFHESSADRLEELIHATDICAEQKMDGARMLTKLAPGQKPEFLQRSGKPMKFAAAKLVLPAIEIALQRVQNVLASWGNMTMYLDGEVMPETGEYRIWDLLNEDHLNQSYALRRSELADLWENAALHPYRMYEGPLKLVTTHLGAEAKRDLWQSVVAAGAEGVMFKSLSAGYDAGDRVRHSVKMKLVKSADVIVSSISEEPLSAELAVYDETGSYRKVGRASLIGKGQMFRGDVVEVNYLYLGAGDKMVQPRIMGKRTDKFPTDCLFEQFPEYSRSIV